MASLRVLLATYNGEKYLNALLESVHAQGSAVASIVVRDDESTDSTPEILARHAEANSKLTWRVDSHIGLPGCFFELLRQSDGATDFYAFCDQDDLWLPGKPQRAVTTLERFPQARPLMYCSRVQYVSDDLEVLGLSAQPRRVGLGNALIENVAFGNTIVLNRAARELIISAVPKHSLMHDWWCYLVVSAFGTVVCDDYVGIKYRQHPANFVGGPRRLSQVSGRRATRRVGTESSRRGQAMEFLQIFGSQLRPSQRKLVEALAVPRRRLISRVDLARRDDLRTQSWQDQWRFRGRVLINQY